MESYNLDPYNNSNSNEHQNYSSCLLEGAFSSSVPCFMTASSPVPFSEISDELSFPHLTPGIECTSVLRNGRRDEFRALGKFKCRRCHKRFQTKGGLNLHLREHQPDLYLIKCPDCPFFTYQKANFFKHTSIKHQKDVDGTTISENINCAQCDFKCFTDEQLKMHIARKHSSSLDKPFKCLECEYASVEKSAVEKHVSIVHRKEREYDCEICGFRSQTSSGLARHNRSHKELKPHHCHICNLPYADKKRLKDHLLKHANVKQYQCSECKYATNRKDNLSTHIRRCHMPP